MSQYDDELIKLIQSDNIQGAIDFFKKIEIDIDFVDQQGNTYFHHIVMSIIRVVMEPEKTPNFDCYFFHLKLMQVFLDNKPVSSTVRKANKDSFSADQLFLFKVDIRWKDYKKIHMINAAAVAVRRQFEVYLKVLYPGKKYVQTLDLVRKSKRQDGTGDCAIPNKWVVFNRKDKLNKVTLHQRLSLTEEHIRNTKGISDDINVIVANIGFVVSDGYRKQNKTHRRKFVTYPLVDEKICLYVKSFGHGWHSEDNLINFLCNNAKQIVSCLDEYKNDENNQHKVYVVVLDIFSTREVCEACTKKLMKLQGETKDDEVAFLPSLKRELNAKNFALPEKAQLQLIIRVSSFENYIQPGGTCSHSQTLTCYPRVEKDFGDEKNGRNNIKDFLPGVILHSAPLDAHKYPKFYEEKSPAVEVLSDEEKASLYAMSKERRYSYVDRHIVFYSNFLKRKCVQVNLQTAFLSAKGKEMESRKKTWADEDHSNSGEAHSVVLKDKEADVRRLLKVHS